MPLTYSLTGQTAIVTGGANGIGKAVAKLLAKAGATVAIFDINTDSDEKVAADIGANAFFIRCDMSDKSNVGQAYQQTIDKVGRIDILVNNVGIWMPGGNILEMSEEIITKMEMVNVLSPMHLTRLVMNGMIAEKRKGCVTFVSSTQAHVIDGSPTIYNVQKNTVLGMTKTFAVAGGPYDIRVNAVSPGAISTEGMGAAQAVGKDRIMAGNRKTPLGRRGTPEEVAQEVVSLCFATYTNGDLRTVDGGFSKVALPESLLALDSIHPDDPDQDFLRSH
jgi:NAD(P)-dependent dehydrogenase (short-subunit alcohol dehydrogenase family)